ncbi:glycosyl hydrolase family 61-domain-containing protein [Plectosphaerella plurivora]|uniref:lytic cellulose monooxygenase (C4-dehydrogenating) n=1 Tax=Plectosphaerella plurivora TaxID=936078 RepID=A0A9P8UZH2_9PEZI|nr:glycosyl hydrolase family 61-domain-containing protein [Plectosphaerella plurivora]
MACNGPPVGFFKSSSDVIEVDAGSKISGQWLHTLTSTGPDEFADNAWIDSSHKGPVTTWMKKVDDATKNPASGPGDGWFKISQDAYTNKKWGVDNLIANKGVQTATIPECIENGDYLVRFEIIALHSAQTRGDAQFYMECAQVRVSGGTGTAKPATVAIPGVYTADDPGVHFSPWNNFGQPYPDSYPMPGPSVFTCGSSANQTPKPLESAKPVETAEAVETSAVETPAVETPVTSEAPAATESTGDMDDCPADDAPETSAVPEATAAPETPAASEAPVAAAAALYGQCGGLGWKGPTTCSAGKCTKSNDWYSKFRQTGHAPNVFA